MGALAFAAVLASHHIAYRLAAPDPHYRAELLHATGHRYFTYIAALGLGLLVAALTTFLRSNVGDVDAARTRFAYVTPRLLFVQLSAFIALEFTERALLGSGTEHLISLKPVLIGLALQFVVAAIGALCLCLVAYVARRLRARAPARTSASPRWTAHKEPPPLRPLVAAGAATPRGPPAL